MTDNEINVAISELCGFVSYDEQKTLFYPIATRSHTIPAKQLPNYCSDLNAMWDVEGTLTNNLRRAYVAALVNVHPLHYDPTLPSDDNWMHIYFLVHATARQRAEAFLRTHSKWKD